MQEEQVYVALHPASCKYGYESRKPLGSETSIEVKFAPSCLSIRAGSSRKESDLPST